MLALFTKKNQCYCAFCRTPRRVYRKKSISLLNIFEALLASLAVMYMIWQKLDPRFVLFFVLFMVVGEMFVRIRWRTSMLCPHCGFDPVLYVKDPQEASRKVKVHLDRRKQDPKYMLARPLNLPALTPERAKMLDASQKKGSIVSRQI